MSGSVGYDISASMDTSSRAATGPIQFGDIYLAQTGGGNGLNWLTIALVAGLVWFFFIRKK